VSADPLRLGVACFSTFGGSGVIASEIGMAMARRGHHVVFFSDQPPARLDLSCPGISFHPVAALNYPVPAQNSYAVSLAAEMIEVAQTEKLDLLHVHYAVPHAFGAYLARQVLGAAAPKMLTTLHGTDVTRIGADPKFTALVRFAVLAGDGITAPSRWLADEALRQLDLPRESRIEVIPNFVDTGRFCPADAKAPAARRVVTHVSNFRLLKRVEDVVRIFARVRGEMPAKLHLAGDGPERSHVEALVSLLGLADDVTFFGERVDVAKVLQGSDVFLLPSETESFGLGALEAMACGVPVVASNVGGLPEVVRDGETGFLAAVGDIGDMAKHVRDLLADPDLHARMSRAARSRAEEHFQLEPAVDRYQAVYRRLLGDARTSSSTR
jgi:N-acetyl-alpha-D-glucosaminyl L-malate synthase BshA